MTESPLVYTSPIAFSLKQRLILGVAAPLIAFLLRMVYATCRIEQRGVQHFEALDNRDTFFLLAIWHESMGLAGCRFLNSGYHGLTSYSFDGEMAARVITHLGMKALRGSSSKGGMKALGQLAYAAKHVSSVGITVDGPKGPRRIVKPGVAILAAKAKVPVLPLACTVDRAWRLRSWDRLPIPKPFSKIVLAFGEPISPPETVTSEAFETTRIRVERDLNALQSEIEQDLGVDPLIVRPESETQEDD